MHQRRVEHALQPTHSLLRGQATVDYLLGLGLVVALVIALGLPMLSEYEQSMALASARSGAWAYLSSNTSRVLEGVQTTTIDSTITFHPLVKLNGNDATYQDSTDNLRLRNAMLESMRAALSPAAVIDYDTGCLDSIFSRKYCVETD